MRHSPAVFYGMKIKYGMCDTKEIQTYKQKIWYAADDGYGKLLWKVLNERLRTVDTAL